MEKVDIDQIKEKMGLKGSDIDRLNDLLKNKDSRFYRMIMYGYYLQTNGRKTLVPGIYQLTVKTHFCSRGRRYN